MSVFRIAHISDLHCGSPHVVPSLMERRIVATNDPEPDVVVSSRDLTELGFRHEYARVIESAESDETVGAVLDLVVAEAELARTAG